MGVCGVGSVGEASADARKGEEVVRILAFENEGEEGEEGEKEEGEGRVLGDERAGEDMVKTAVGDEGRAGPGREGEEVKRGEATAEAEGREERRLRRRRESMML